MQYIKDKEKKLSHRDYDSFAEFMDYIEKEPSKELGKLSSRKNESMFRDRWYGTNSFEEAMTLAREGWKDGLELISNLSAKLERSTSHLVTKPSMQWDVAGDFADAGLFVTGVPECMGSFVEMEIDKPIVRILMNLSVSCGVGAEAIMRRGAACVALVDALENAGRSCEIVVAAGSGYSYDQETWKTMHVVPVKLAGEPLELDRMAFLLAHPSSFRRLFFSAWEHEDKDVRKALGIMAGGGYGCCMDFKDPTADVVVPTMDLYRQDNDEEILAWIRSELKRQGCEIEGE